MIFWNERQTSRAVRVFLGFSEGRDFLSVAGGNSGMNDFVLPLLRVRM